MTDESKKELAQLKKELPDLEAELADNQLLKRYYSGADDLEQDTKNLIKAHERQVKLIKLLDE